MPRQPRTLLYDRDKKQRVTSNADGSTSVQEGRVRVEVGEEGRGTFDVEITKVNLLALNRVKSYLIEKAGDDITRHNLTFQNGETAILAFGKSGALIGFQTTCPIRVGQDGVLDLHDMMPFQA